MYRERLKGQNESLKGWKTMKKVLSFVLILVIAMSVVGCDTKQQSELEASDNSGLRIYRTDLSESELVWEYADEPTGNKETQIRTILAGLEEASRNPEMKKLKPDNVSVIGHEIGPDGQLIVDFSGGYTEMPVVTELLLRAGYVKSLCQIEGIDYVEFYVEGQPLIIGQDYVIGQMKSTDFVDNTGESVNFGQEVFMTVYFPDMSTKMLEATECKVNYEGTRSYEELVIRLLLNGPVDDGGKLRPVMPEGTQLNSITSKDDIVYVDFNDKFLSYREDIGEELTLFSVVNSLCDLHGITKVKLTVNSENRKAFNKYMKDGFFERKPELIISEKAGDVDG